ncbi:MAG TPA: N-acetyl-gamma-glutamyl-phosphate reductase [Thermoanaerobaculia bacterium]|nr:N-acetyl-gamma-glutamyl-phosphate reductase [Thermoanaerobaculia bacterium]
MTNVLRVAVVGATGYTGSELTAILARHPRTEIAALFSGPSGERVAFSALHPSLRGARGPEVVPFEADALREAGADLVLLATPNETSARLAPSILAFGAKVIDLSGAFRLRDASAYPSWYGFDHPAPELLAEAVYGLTEHCNGELAGARLVANPGCYPTATLLALLPIVDLVEPSQTIVCDVKSGVSGAGKKRDLDYSFAELSGNFKAYGIGRHRHEPEIRAGLGLAASAPLVFVPHLLPTTRGILATLYVSFAEPQSEASILARFEAAYADSALVQVHSAGTLPELRHVVGTPRAEIGFALLDGGRRAVVVSVIDNLLKGAASQAVQNLNRMHQFEEKEGLA